MNKKPKFEVEILCGDKVTSMPTFNFWDENGNSTFEKQQRAFKELTKELLKGE